MRTHTRASQWGVLSLALVPILALPSPARAAVFSVTSSADQVDVTPGDGICETATGNGVCTLRAAVQESNALPGPDTLRVPAGSFQLTRTGSEDQAAFGDLDILDDLVIKGSGPPDTAIDGLGSDRIFDCGPALASTLTVRLSGLVLRNGAAGDGAAVRATCNLTVTNSVIEDNSSWNRGAIYVKGSDSRLELVHSLVRNNSLHGIVSYEAGELMIRDSQFIENSGGLGGALFDFYGDTFITVLDSTFSRNAATAEGGAIAAGNLFVSGSTFDENTAASASALFPEGPVEIVSSTFSGNRATEGPAISGGQDLSLQNVTFFYNDDWSGNGAGALETDAMSGITLLSNTLFRDNLPSSCLGPSFSSLGHNLSDDSSCQLDAAGDWENTDATLDPTLAANGGRTMTHALTGEDSLSAYGPEHGSPLPEGTGGGACEITDQRGVDRPLHNNHWSPARCDIGAFESCVWSWDVDSDGDGLTDECDWDDDDDGCPDAEDENAGSHERQVGYFKDFCGGSHPLMVFEGSDSDNDGRLNCEDDDDDDDGVPDEEDHCLGPALATCIQFGNYPCLPSFLECLGGSCVRLLLRFVAVSNPNPEAFVDLEPTAIRADTLYAAPLRGLDARATVERIAGKAVQVQARVKTPTRADRFALEIWRKNADGRPVERLFRVAEYSQASLRLGDDNGGQVIAIRASARAGEPLVLGTTFVTGAPLTGLRDADADLVPDAYDLCPWQAGGIEDTRLGTTCSATRPKLRPGR